MKFQDLDFSSLLYGFISILPWTLVLYYTFPKEKYSKTKFHLAIILGFIGGIISTYLILKLNPIIWPEVDIRARRPRSILTQTIHIAFIQAGMIEEAFKSFFILLFGFLFFRDKKNLVIPKHPEGILFFHKFLFPMQWSAIVVPLAGFTALGFAFIENSYYIGSEISERKIETLLGRTIHSSSIHLLINLCFSLFLLKSNTKESLLSKFAVIGFAFGLAVIQHGVVDFFLIPSSSLGGWLATAMFVGIWVWVARDYRYYVLEKKWEII